MSPILTSDLRSRPKPIRQGCAENERRLRTTVESQLQEQTVLALNNPSFIQLKGKKVLLSQIFEWYKEDFTRNGDEIDFLNRFRKEPLDPKTMVGYYPYDWTLNDTK